MQRMKIKSPKNSSKKRLYKIIPKTQKPTIPHISSPDLKKKENLAQINTALRSNVKDLIERIDGKSPKEKKRVKTTQVNLKPAIFRIQSPRAQIIQRQKREKRNMMLNLSYQGGTLPQINKGKSGLGDLSMTLPKSPAVAGYAAKFSNSFVESPRIIKTIAEENLEGHILRKGNLPEKITSFPQVRQPLRIELPPYFNTPKRKALPERIRNKVSLVYGNKLPSIKNMCIENLDSDERLRIQKRLRDYEMIAFACKRANKVRDEGRAYYSMGVLCDNLANYKQAIQYYQKFLQICKTVKDLHGEALAYNCIGVNYQFLGTNDKSLLPKSIEFHEKHKEISDIHGKFIAHINLGLLYDVLDDRAKSTINYQFALKYAILLSSPAGQTVALGNLSEHALDPAGNRIKQFAEQYLELCTEINNKKAEGNAYLQLGKIYSCEKNYETGSDNFEKAFRLAKKTGDSGTYEEARCNFAYANANVNMENHMSDILHTLQVAYSPKDKEDQY